MIDKYAKIKNRYKFIDSGINSLVSGKIYQFIENTWCVCLDGSIEKMCYYDGMLMNNHNKEIAEQLLNIVKEYFENVSLVFIEKAFVEWND